MKLIKPRAVIGLTLILINGFTWAEQLNFPHVLVTGYGEVEVKPDMATYKVKVIETTTHAEKAKRTVDLIVDNYLIRLEESGVNKSDISSSNLSLTPQYANSENEKPELIGYQAFRSIDIKVMDLTKLNDYLDIGLEVGVTEIANIQLKVKDEMTYQGQARLFALEDARVKATSLVQAMKRSLGEVWKIEYSTPNSAPVISRSVVASQNGSVNYNSRYQDSSILIKDRIKMIYAIDPEIRN